MSNGPSANGIYDGVLSPPYDFVRNHANRLREIDLAERCAPKDGLVQFQREIEFGLYPIAMRCVYRRDQQDAIDWANLVVKCVENTSFACASARGLCSGAE